MVTVRVPLALATVTVRFWASTPSIRPMLVYICDNPGDCPSGIYCSVAF